MKAKLILIIITLSMAPIEASSNEVENKLKKVTEDIDYRYNTELGTSISVTKDNQTIYTATNGMSNLELGTENFIETMYDLASIGKMFTGYSIALLESQGKISLDDDIRKYLENFPSYGHKITVANLVHHTSGIKNWTYLIQEMGWHFEDKITTEQILRAIYAQKNLDFIPGEKYQYSNSGYTLLSKIVENISGQSFKEFTDENIFKPLNMKNTFFNDNQNQIIKKMASAYMLDNDYNDIREAYNTSVLGSSSLISNALDMTKWMNFLLSPPNDKTKVIDLMFKTRKLNNGQENNYAYGIRIEYFNGMKTLGHSGSWSSFTSNMKIIPDLNVGIFFANNYRVNTRNIMDEYLNIFIPGKKENNEGLKQKAVSKPEEEITLTEQELDKYVGLYRLGEAWYLDIFRKGTELYTQANGETAFFMKPIGDSEFLVRQYGNRTIKFEANEEGKFDALIYNEIRANRKDSDFYFNAESFKKYEGVYYSTELDVLYKIKIVGNKLLYKNIKTGDYELFYENDNFFFTDGKLSKITFQVGHDDNIAGFHKVNSKKKKLYFFKKAD